MEKTIKEELGRKTMSSQLLNENSLLVVSKSISDPIPVASVRYIEDDCIKESGIAHLIPGTIVRYNEKILGTFIPNYSGNGETLTTAYNLETHEFVENDLLKTIYYSKINDEKPMQYIKVAHN